MPGLPGWPPRLAVSPDWRHYPKVLSLNAMVVSHNGSQLFYTKEGNGKHTMLVFHGFGQDHSAFRTLVQRLSPAFTCYSFDLFFHGQSVWSEPERTLEKSEWKQILQALISENNIDKFSVLGFSMGGKLALATLEAFPEKLNDLILIAPDGIKTSFWYRLATYPVAFRKVFKSMITHHGRFLNLGRTVSSVGLLDKGLLRFAETQMNSEEKRKRVYYSWVVLRHLRFDLQTIASSLNQFGIRTILLVGRRDRVISPEHMTSFVQKLKKVDFITIDEGHTRILQASEEHVVERLLPKQM